LPCSSSSHIGLSLSNTRKLQTALNHLNIFIQSSTLKTHCCINFRNDCIVSMLIIQNITSTEINRKLRNNIPTYIHDSSRRINIMYSKDPPPSMVTNLEV